MSPFWPADIVMLYFYEGSGRLGGFGISRDHIVADPITTRLVVEVNHVSKSAMTSLNSSG